MKRFTVSAAAVLVLILVGAALAQNPSGSSTYPQQTGSTSPAAPTDATNPQQVSSSDAQATTPPSATSTSPTASTTDPTDTSMPKTASPMPLIGMTGLAALALGLVVRRMRRTA